MNPIRNVLGNPLRRPSSLRIWFGFSFLVLVLASYAMLGMYHSQLSEGNDRDGTSFYNVSKPKTDLGGISVASERSQRRDEATPINVDEILPPPPTTNEPLNVVLLYADDWSFSTLGAMGNTVVKTPALDALAAKGVLFSHNCVVTSVCMQSRYGGQ